MSHRYHALEEGPTLILAKIVSKDGWKLGKAAIPIPFGGGSGCPKGTKQVVRVTCSAGVTNPAGGEVDDLERVQYQITVLIKSN